MKKPPRSLSSAFNPTLRGADSTNRTGADRTRASRRTKAARNGFTLIELLVVVAILAILAAVLFPAFARARGSAQRTTCQSNLKQLSTAFDLYLESWDDVYPNSWQARDSDYGELNHGWWDEQLFPFVKTDGIFACPTNDVESFSVHQPFNARGEKTRRVNYALNNQLLQCPPGPSRFDYLGAPPEPAARGDVESSAETILLTEKMLDEANHRPSPPDSKGNQSAEIDVWFHLTGPGLDPATWNDSWGVARALHNKGCNFLFTDGHVKYLRLQDTLSASPSPSTDAGALPSTGEVDPYLWKLRKKGG
jgi:prepilin-type N-terminal cleavage/methylation domain-containing protein/prepilin-type processing-associated H-X9-DG protein